MMGVSYTKSALFYCAMNNKLTAKQQRFVEEYLVDLNATQAAIRAGYSEDTAGVIACENLMKPNIQQALDVKRQELAQKTGITTERVLNELAAIGFSRLTDYTFDDYGHVDAAGESIGAVSSIKRKTFCDKEGNQMGVETEIKLWDKVAALDKLGKHLGLFKEDAPKSGDTINNFIKVEFVTPDNANSGGIQRVIPAKKI